MIRCHLFDIRGGSCPSSGVRARFLYYMMGGNNTACAYSSSLFVRSMCGWPVLVTNRRDYGVIRRERLRETARRLCLTFDMKSGENIRRVRCDHPIPFSR